MKIFNLKMNNRGIMRIIEATVAVLAVLVALILLSSFRVSHKTEDLNKILPPLLDEIAQNKTLREGIVNNNKTVSEGLVTSSLKARITNPALNYSVRVCNLSEVCYLEPYPSNTEKNIFTSERVISASIKNETFEPKKVKVFLWEKEN